MFRRHFILIMHEHILQRKLLNLTPNFVFNGLLRRFYLWATFCRIDVVWLDFNFLAFDVLYKLLLILLDDLDAVVQDSLALILESLVDFYIFLLSVIKLIVQLNPILRLFQDRLAIDAVLGS